MAYRDTIIADGVRFYQEFSTGTITSAGSMSSTISNSGVVSGVAGGVASTNKATFNGSSNYTINSTNNWTSDKAFAVEGWFKTTSNASNQTILARGTLFPHLNISIQSGTFKVAISGSSNQVIFTGVSGVNDGNWHHFVFSADGSNGMIYLDGTLRETLDLSSTGTVSMSVATNIGATGGTNFFTGDMDEIGIYGDPLTLTQVANHYSQGGVGGSVVTVNAAAGTPQVINITSPNAVGQGNVVNKTVAAGAPQTINITSPDGRVSLIKTINFANYTVGGTGQTPGFSGTGTIVSDLSAGSGKAMSFPSAAFMALYTGASSVAMPTTSDTLLRWYKNNASVNASMQIGLPVVGTTSGTIASVFLAISQGPSGNFTRLMLGNTVLATSSAGYPLAGISTKRKVFTRINYANQVIKVRNWLEGDVEPSTWDINLDIGAPGAYTSGRGYSITETSVDDIGVGVTNLRVDNFIWSNDALITAAPPGTDAGYGAQASTINISAPNATNSGAANVVAGVVGQVSLSTPSTISVATSGNVSFGAGPMVINITAPNSSLILPEKVVSATPAEVTVFVPNGHQGIAGSDKVVSAGAPQVINISTPQGVTQSNQTDRVVQAGVAARIDVAAKDAFFGEYDVTNDKWFQYIDATLNPPYSPYDQNESWFRLDEESGTSAINYSGTGPTATYYGGPTLGIEAPFRRKGVSLDGFDDYVEWEAWFQDGQLPGGNTPPGGYPGPASSIEWTMRTTATSGVIFSGQTNFLGATEGFTTLEVTANGLRVGNVQSTINGSTTTYFETFTNIDLETPINDGEWHHFTVLTSDLEGRATIMIDGKVVWSRISWNINGRPQVFGTPETLGRRTVSNNPAVNALGARYLKADFSSFIVRNNEWYGRDHAQRSYYIWANHTLIAAPTASISVAAQEAKGRGNTKKMLLLYGNAETKNNNGELLNAYYSSWSGIGYPNSPHAGRDMFGQQTPVDLRSTFDYNGYKVYPVNMFERARSAQGIVTQTGERYFFDNESGDIRYIDINKDLDVDVTDFDVIHVMHWPAPNTGSPSGIGGFRDRDESTYDRLREQLRDSILLANQKGVKLWIAEAQMAVEFGIATGYDTHWMPYENIGAIGSPGASAHEEEIDNLYYPANTNGSVGGGYLDTSSIDRRRIVAAAPGFSEFPTWWVNKNIEWYSLDQYMAHSFVYAHNIQELPNGLVPGTEFSMRTGSNWSGAGAYRGQLIYSLKSNGVKGLIIAKETANYWNNGELVVNPFADNATTVLVEKGTSLNGISTGARIFVELMDNNWDLAPVRQQTQYKGYVNGQLEANPTKWSNWDFDTRRNRAVFSWLVVEYVRTVENRQITTKDETPYFTMSDLPLERLPFVGMNQRGLNWLTADSSSNDGSVRTYANAVNVNIGVQEPTKTAGRNVTVSAEPARVRLEVRKPVGTLDPDARVIADAIVISIKSLGNQKVIEAGPATVTVTPGNFTLARGEGEDIVMYLQDNNFTLYMGDD